MGVIHFHIWRRANNNNEQSRIRKHSKILKTRRGGR
jgi:hypothetical protein